jgi:transcriptional regulator with XRE-family HTH domain
MSISLHIVGQRIVTKRKSMKLSQVELAEKVGISDRTLGKIEKGFDMRLSLMLAIADALDIEPTELLSERIDDELTSLSYVEKQQILSHLKAICQLLPD